MTPTALIRRDPTDADIVRMVSAACAAVLEIASADGAIGHDKVNSVYMRRVYAAVIAGEVKSRKPGASPPITRGRV